MQIKRKTKEYPHDERKVTLMNKMQSKNANYSTLLKLYLKKFSQLRAKEPSTINLFRKIPKLSQALPSVESGMYFAIRYFCREQRKRI